MRLHDYQKEAHRFAVNRIVTHKGAGLWLDPGLGKTAVALHTIPTLQLLEGIRHSVVIAPARVLETSWPGEIEKWKLPLTYAWIKGSEVERQEALDSKADIYFLGCENLAKVIVDKQAKRQRKRMQLPDWLDRVRFSADYAIIDESTKFKSWSSARSKYLRKLLQRIPRRLALTGTPAPNNIGADLFSQHFILDSGKTLGTTVTGFRERWMRSCGYENRQWEMVPELVPTFLDLISPWYLRQEVLDHLDMPELINNEIEIVLPEKAMKVYKEMEKEMYVEIEQNELAALSAGSKYSLCRQIASGSAYDPEKRIIEIHDAKLDAVENLFEELNGKPLLIGFNFLHELKKLQKRWPNIAFIAGGVKNTKEIIAKWRSGQIKLLAAQTQSISHGVNGLQSGNDLVWFSPVDRPEDRDQFERRLWRQGVVGNVRVHHLLCRGTVEKKIKRVSDNKSATQQDVLRAIKDAKKTLSYF